MKDCTQCNLFLAVGIPRRLDSGGGRVVQWCWVNFQCRSVQLIWIIVGQRPTALAVGTGGVVWTFFLSYV